MNSLLLLLALCGEPNDSIDEATVAATREVVDVAELAATLAPQLRTGSLLFGQGDCLAVKVYTRSSYTHVAAVVLRDGEPFVYDAQNGHGVRCQTLANYLRSQRPSEVHVLQPRDPFSDERGRAFSRSLDGQLGRPYAIKHFATGERADGLHCSEYVTDALIAGGVMKAERPARVSPASLAAGALETGLFTHAETLRVQLPTPNVAQADSWCGQMWLDTKSCCSRCCAQISRWVLCR